MAEKSPESSVPKDKSDEEEKASEGNLQGSFLPEVKVEASAETGYSSAPHSSGAEGTSECVWTSDEHGTEVQTLRPAFRLRETPRKKSPKKSAVDSGNASKSEGTTEFEDKTSRLKIRKKLSPAKQVVVEASVQSGQEGPSMARQYSESADEETSPTKRESAEEASPHKSKSGRKTFSSMLKSLKKQTTVSSDEQQPPATDPGKPEKSSKAVKSAEEKSVKSPRKGLKVEFSLFSPKKKAVETTSKAQEGGSLEVQQPQETETREKAAKSSSPSKRKMLSKFKLGKSKSPSKKEAASTPSEFPEAKSLPEPSKAGKIQKSPAKPKRTLKSPFGKAKSPAKQGAAATSLQQSSSKGPQSSDSPRSLVSTADLAKHVKKVDLSGLKHTKRSDKVPLTEEMMETSDSEDAKTKTVSEVKHPVVSQTVECPEKRTHWYSMNIFHGEFPHKDVRTTLSSSTDDTPTETSTVSDSSGIHGGSESKKAASSDSLSGLEEEPMEGASGLQEEHVSKRPVQRQKRVIVEYSDSDEETRDFQSICGSPCKKVPPRSQDSEKE